MSDKGTIILLPRGDRLDAALLREGRKDQLASEALSAPESTDAVASEGSGGMAKVPATIAGIQGPLQIVLPASSVLLRIEVLPTDDESEIRGMVELQMDKLAPYPLEHCLVSWELLSREERGLRVLMVAVPRTVLAPWQETLPDAATRIERIDVDVLGWWKLLQDARRIETEGCHLLVLLEETQAVVLLLDGGIPIQISAYNLPRDEDPTEFFRDVAEDVRFSLMSAESEGAGRQPRGVDVWHADAWSPDRSAWSDAMGLPLHPHPLSELPPLIQALAARGATVGEHASPDQLNLVPADWVAAREEQAFRAQMLTTLLGVLAAWLVVVGGAIAFFSTTDRQVQEWQNKSNRLADSVEESSETEQRIEALRQFSDRTYSGLECLREVSLQMPRGVLLSGLNYRKSKDVGISGVAESNSAAFEFAGNIADSGLFVASQVDFVRQQPRGQGYSFRILARLPGIEEGEASE